MLDYWQYESFVIMLYFFFFKQKTAYEMRISDWSSDVCSSDLCFRSAVAATCGTSERRSRPGRSARTIPPSRPTPAGTGGLRGGGAFSCARRGFSSRRCRGRIPTILPCAIRRGTPCRAVKHAWPIGRARVRERGGRDV